MESLPRQIVLGPAEYFALVVDRDMRRARFAGNVCQLFVRLGGELAREDLQARLADHPAAQWAAGARLRVPISPLLPSWKFSPRPFTVEAHDEPLPESPFSGDAFQVSQHWLVEVSRRSGKLIRIDLFPNESGGTDLVLTWNHALMDARGAELFLAQVLGDAPAAALHWAPPALEGSRGDLAWRARETGIWMEEKTEWPLTSLAKPIPPRPQIFHTRFSFTEEETSQLDDAANSHGATLRRSLWHLAAAIRAFLDLADERGGEVMPVTVPVPQDLRRRGVAGPVFSNPVAIGFYRVEPADQESALSIFRALVRQQKEQLAEDRAGEFLNALKYFRHLPLGLYSWLMKRPSRRLISSFYFSDLGENLTFAKSLCGLPVEDLMHLPPVGAPPGLGFVFSRFRGRQRMTITHVPPALDHAAIARLGEAIGETLRTPADESGDAIRKAG